MPFWRYAEIAEVEAEEYVDMLREEEFADLMEGMTQEGALYFEKFYLAYRDDARAIVEMPPRKQLPALAALSKIERFLMIASCARLCFEARALFSAASEAVPPGRSRRKNLQFALSVAHAHFEDDEWIWPFPCEIPEE